MQYNKRDKQVFDSLGNGRINEAFLDYCDKVIAEAYDSRNWPDDIDGEKMKGVAQMVEDLIQEHFKDRASVDEPDTPDEEEQKEMSNPYVS